MSWELKLVIFDLVWDDKCRSVNRLRLNKVWNPNRSGCPIYELLSFFLTRSIYHILGCSNPSISKGFEWQVNLKCWMIFFLFFLGGGGETRQ